MSATTINSGTLNPKSSILLPSVDESVDKLVITNVMIFTK